MEEKPAYALFRAHNLRRLELPKNIFETRYVLKGQMNLRLSLVRVLSDIHTTWGISSSGRALA